jgi:hypothetical protein
MGCCTGSAFTPAPDAALDPLQRVNYTFGMVLGVDDFRQEQTYLRARDDALMRELVGYGVIRGLTVTLQGQTVRVSPGMALMPDGRLVAVQVEQCADFATWREAEGKATTGLADDQTVYVRLFAADASGSPVPIPGEPCRDESELSADARIADSFRLDFSLTAPDASEDLALRAVVAWIRAIRVGPTGSGTLDEFRNTVQTALLDAIKTTWGGDPHAPKTEQPTLALPDALPPPPAGLRIPRAQLTEYYTAAFDVWVQMQRSEWMAHHGPVPVAAALPERGLLLAAIEVQGKQAKNIRMLGRQQLLHLRLLQEWLLRDGSQDAPREAHFVLGKGDPELDHAQDLLLDFTGHDHAMTRIDIVADNSDDHGLKASIVPAVKWPGTGIGGGPDYYGPDMTQPIPVADGGTGQNAAPDTGMLLVGRAGSDSTGPAHFELGTLIGASLPKPEGSLPNIIVDAVGEAPTIRLDTVQDIGPSASPKFAGLDVNGMLTARELVVETDAWVHAKLSVDGPLVLGTPKRHLLAADGSGTVVEAQPWDGVEAALDDEKGPIYAYQPNQPAPVRIEDGGTGLQQRPLDMQVLIGSEPKRARGQGGDYVLAKLVAGNNVTVSLDPVKDGESTSSQWALTIAATGGGGGGSTKVVAGGKPPSLRADTNSDGVVTIDTVQALHVEAKPRFQALSLGTLTDRAGKFVVGWDDASGDLLRQPAPVFLAGPESASLRVTQSPGVVIFETVQALHQRASPTFVNVQLDGLAGRTGGKDAAPVAWDPSSRQLVLTANQRGISSVVVSTKSADTLRATTAGDVVTLDTAQALHEAATPRFESLQLGTLRDASTETDVAVVGWKKGTRELVQTKVSGGSTADVGVWKVRIADNTSGIAAITDDDQVVVFSRGGDIRLPDPAREDTTGKPFTHGRVIVIKLMRTGGQLNLSGLEQDQRGVVQLTEGEARTVMALTDRTNGFQPQWIVIGKG